MMETLHRVTRRRAGRVWLLTAAAAACLLLLGGCQGSAPSTVPSATTGKAGVSDMARTGIATGIILRSASFGDGGAIPLAQACQRQGGGNQSPQLSWSGQPAGTASFALIMDDDNPPCGSGDQACRHWAVFNLPASVTRLEAGQDLSGISGSAQGLNYTGTNGYAGPCPPQPHTYRITLYALDSGMPRVEAGASLTHSSFEAAYGAHILGSAKLTGVFPG